MRTVIIRSDHLGDLVLTTPLIRSLAKGGHLVDCLVKEAWKPMLDHNPYLVASFSMEDICPAFPQHWTQLAKWLRKGNYDCVILPYAQPKALLYASLSSLIPRRIAMWAGVAGRLTFHRCLRSGLPEHPRHMSDIWLDCARAIGLSDDGLEPDFFLSEEEKNWAQKEIQKRFATQPVIGIHPGCSGNTCNLPTEEYGKLTERLLTTTSCGIIITGSENELALLRNWPDTILRSPRVWNTMGTLNLRQLAALIQAMRLLVCVGTGPLHIASATRTPTVSPFCPYVGVSPQLWGNLGAKNAVLEMPSTACEKIQKQCNDHCDFRGQITAETVYAKVCGLLGSRL